jgi:hypothetical protein
MRVAGRSVSQLTLDRFGIVVRCDMGEPSSAYHLYRTPPHPGAGNLPTLHRKLLSPRAIPHPLARMTLVVLYVTLLQHLLFFSYRTLSKRLDLFIEKKRDLAATSLISVNNLHLL